MKSTFRLSALALALALSVATIAGADSQTVNFEALVDTIISTPLFGEAFEFLDPTIEGESGDNNGNGVVDLTEFAVLAGIFADVNHPDHTLVHEAWKANVARMETDLGATVATFTTLHNELAQVMAAYVTMADGSFSTTNFESCSMYSISGSLGVPPEVIAGIQAEVGTGTLPDYLANYNLSAGHVVSICGDADGDGVPNLNEFNAAADDAAYIAAALNPAITTDGGDPDGYCSSGGAGFAGLGYVYSPDTGKVYYLNRSVATWECAQEYAESHHMVGDTQVAGNLVTIESALENQFLVDNITTAFGEDVWTGATDLATEDVWVWASSGAQFWQGKAAGSAVGGLYNNWNGGEPNGNDEDAMELKPNGGWNDQDHTDEQPSIIEFTDLNGTPFTDNNANDIPDQFEQLLSITTVTISPNSAELLSGLDPADTQNLSAVSSDETDTAFTWMSSNEAVATVVSTGDVTAKVTAVAPGTAVISATANTTAAVGNATITVRIPEWFEACDLSTQFSTQGGVIAGLGLDDALPTNWEAWDVELGVGDGVPDAWQLYLLAYAICGDDNAAAEAAYEANLAEVQQLATDLVPAVAFLSNSLTIVPDLQALATALPTALGGACDQDISGALGVPGPVLASQYLAGVVIPLLQDPDTADEVGLMQVLTALIPGITQWLAGMNTVSTEMVGTLGALLPVEAVNDAVEQFGALALLLANLANNCPDASVSTPAASALATMGINPLSPPLVPLPTYAAYQDAGKLANEPVSGAGDYNDDGFTNAEVAAAVIDAGGDEDDFIAGATGDFGPFWPGNPNLPVGVAVLGGLIGALAVGGAAAIRRRKRS